MRACLFAVALSLLPGLPAAAQQATMRALQTTDDGKGWEAVGRIELGDRGFCTGALIADDLVLTAAHCLFDKDTGARIDAADLRFLAGWRNGRAEAYRGVTRALAHPDYEFEVGEDLANTGVDVALLRLDQPIRLPQVTPFATDAESRMGDEVGIVSYAKDRSEAPSLQEVCKIMAQRADLMQALQTALASALLLLAAVLFALPEEEARDFVFGRAGVVLARFREDLLRVRDVVVVLFTSIPIDGFAHLVDPRGGDRGGTLGRIDGPGVGAILVAGVDFAFEDVAFAAGREQIPAEATIANTAL